MEEKEFPVEPGTVNNKINRWGWRIGTNYMPIKHFLFKDCDKWVTKNVTPRPGWAVEVWVGKKLQINRIDYAITKDRIVFYKPVGPLLIRPPWWKFWGKAKYVEQFVLAFERHPYTS